MKCYKYLCVPSIFMGWLYLLTFNSCWCRVTATRSELSEEFVFNSKIAPKSKIRGIPSLVAFVLTLPVTSSVSDDARRCLFPFTYVHKHLFTWLLHIVNVAAGKKTYNNICFIVYNGLWCRLLRKTCHLRRRSTKAILFFSYAKRRYESRKLLASL